MLGLRPMRDGDDVRDIYWKRSTLRGPKVVMERATEVQSRAHLHLDNVFTGEKPSSDRLTLFERQVRDVASQAVAHLRRGEPVTISTKSGATHASHPAEGADSILRFLALIELTNEVTDGDRKGPTSVHLARDFSRAPRASAPSLIMAPVHLSSPASTHAKKERRRRGEPGEAPAPTMSRMPSRRSRERDA